MLKKISPARISTKSISEKKVKIFRAAKSGIETKKFIRQNLEMMKRLAQK